MISTLILFTFLKVANAFPRRDTNEILFDPYFGLEILVIVSVCIFSIILIILLIILHPPQCCLNGTESNKMIPYQFLPFGSFSSEGSQKGYQNQFGPILPSDLDSFYIPAENCRARDNIRKKIVVNNKQRRVNRHEGMINSTCIPNMPEMTFNRYFPGLQEISRISTMNSTMKTVKPLQVARPYRKPKLPQSQKPLRSILKKSTTGSTIDRTKTSTFVV